MDSSAFRSLLGTLATVLVSTVLAAIGVFALAAGLVWLFGDAAAVVAVVVGVIGGLFLYEWIDDLVGE